MSDENHNDHSTTIRDVEQLGTFSAIASLSYVFWICGGMEMVERLAYYGVRSLSSLYATDSAANGGLGLIESQLGIIFMVWALIQTFVPVFTGGLSDRYGYKETIFASTVFKIIGYLIMAFFPTFWGFLIGAAVLAFGTGIFKPGIQGTIVKATNRKNSSIAWGVFYQTVNIGAFIGPLISAQLRQLEWQYVFFACSATYAAELETVVVTGRATEANKSEVSGSVSIVEEQEIALIKHSHVNEVTERVAGVWVSRGNGQEHLTAIRSPVFTGSGSCGAFA